MTRESGSGLLRFLLPGSVVSLDTAVLLLCLLVAYLTASTVYSLTLHPLADVPGPRLCAISRIPYWLEYMRGADVLWMHRLHTQYGPVLRFGPTDLSYTTAEAWKDIHGYGRGNSENGKAQEFSVQPVNGVMC